VEGRFERQIKGGYEVRIGRRRAFCPISQIDLRGADASAHEGHVYQFRLIEYKEGGENIVVSRRALLEDEQRVNASKVRDKIVPGAVITGRVASVRDFGAFVDLRAGVQGSFTCPRWRGPACRTRRRWSKRARRSRSRFCAWTRRSRRYRSG